jgi:hypothetical protein
VSTIWSIRIVSVVVALHLIVLSFFFYKPPVNYFLVVCFSTVIVWPLVFSLSRRKGRAGIIAGFLLQLAIQQVAFLLWVSGQAGGWWPLAQCVSLQYVAALRLGSSPKDTSAMPDDKG